MRSRPVALLPLLGLLLAACATPDAPPARRFAARRPAADPYAAPVGEEFPAATRLNVTAWPDWPHERLTDEVGAISSLVELRPHRASLELLGPEAHVDAVAAYLADRASFVDRQVILELAQVRIPPGAWAFGALAATEGGLWAVGPREEARALVASGRPEDGCRLLAADGGEARVRSLDRRAYLAGCSWTGPDLNPDVAVMTLGLDCTLLPRLAAEGGLLVLEVALDRKREADGDVPVVRIESEGGFTSLPVELPRVDVRRLTGRFVLRRGEALVCLQAPTDAGDLLATVITWSARRLAGAGSDAPPDPVLRLYPPLLRVQPPPWRG